MNDLLVRAGTVAGLDRLPGMNDGCIRDTVDAHDSRGWNYCWLTPMAGLLLWVDHREPSVRITKENNQPAAEWKTYSRWHWARHSAVVDHNPTKLVQEHVRWYVDDRTKLIDLRFYFQLPSGLVYVTSPIERFYELERDFFRKHGLCSRSGDKEAGFTPKQVERMISDAYNLKGLAPYIPAEKIMLSMVPTPRASLSALKSNLAQQKVPHRVRKGGARPFRAVSTV